MGGARLLDLLAKIKFLEKFIDF